MFHAAGQKTLDKSSISLCVMGSVEVYCLFISCFKFIYVLIYFYVCCLPQNYLIFLYGVNWNVFLTEDHHIWFQWICSVYYLRIITVICLYFSHLFVASWLCYSASYKSSLLLLLLLSVCADNSEDLIYLRFLKIHSCYDVIPTSTKLVVLDTQLNVSGCQ